MTDPNVDSEQRRAVIVTVHGTNDGVRGSPDDTKWWEKSSTFAQQLTEMLGQKGVSTEIDEHVWGGANSAYARQKGAISLVRKLRHHSKMYDEVHLIGHSHGGNVAVDAARLIAWGKEGGGKLFGQRRVEITSLTTVGTPFLRAQARGSDYFSALAFVILVLVAVMIFAIGPAITLANVAGLLFKEGFAPPTRQIILSMISTIFLVLAIILLRKRWGHFRWIAGLMKRQAHRANLLSIWHMHDEAIGALKRAEEFQPVLLHPGSLWSGGHRLGAKIGFFVFVVLELLVVACVGAIAVGALFPDGSFGAWVQSQVIEMQLGGFDQTALIATLSVLGLVAGALCAVGVYMFVRIVFGALPELVLRTAANAAAVRVLRGFAFGSDTGQSIGQVSERPHFYEGAVWSVPSPLAERMAEQTLKSLTELLSRHRTALFGISVTPEWMTEIGSDTETWNSLIHTTYFDHPEIAERIASHIAGAPDASSDNNQQRSIHEGRHF
jgi:hypothetical protein